MVIVIPLPERRWGGGHGLGVVMPLPPSPHASSKRKEASKLWPSGLKTERGHGGHPHPTFIHPSPSDN